MFKSLWGKLVDWVHDSESIAWARFKVGVGVVLFVVQQSGVDLSLFMDAKWVAVLKILSVVVAGEGLWSEYMRRRRRGLDLVPPSDGDI